MTSTRVEVLRVDDPAWEENLSAVTHDVYHGVGYHHWQEEFGVGSALMAVVSDPKRGRGLLWPYMLQPVSKIPELLDAPAFDVTSVYGYPGPLAWGCVPGDSFVSEAAAALVEVWRSQGAVAAFTRFHPLLGNRNWADGVAVPGPNGEDSVVLVGETVSIDLVQPEATALAAYGRTLRQEIARARAAGFKTRLDEDWSGLEVFSELYHSTMVRSGATADYFFTTTDFRRLKEALGGELHLITTELDGRAAAAGLFTEHGGIVQAHLVGTNVEFHAWSPLKLLLDDVRRLSSERGNRTLHLGGGRGGREDSLLAFKGRFSPRRHEFYVGRWILDGDSYATLTSMRELRANAAGRQVADQGWFPAYRAPLTAPDG